MPRVAHPPLVHIPIGGVVAAAICDVVSMAGGSAHSWAHAWFKGGSYALMIGTGVLFVAAAAGFADRNRHTSPGSANRSRVNRHAAVMSLLAILAIADIVLRNNLYPGARHTPVAVLVLTLICLALTVAGGELGGRLVHRHAIGVSAQESPATSGAGDFAGSAR